MVLRRKDNMIEFVHLLVQVCSVVILSFFAGIGFYAGKRLMGE
jgi:hypothetical protein